MDPLLSGDGGQFFWSQLAARLGGAGRRIGRRRVVGHSWAAAPPPPPRRGGVRGSKSGRETRTLPSLYPKRTSKEFEAIQSHENAHVGYLSPRWGEGTPRPKPSFVNLSQASLLGVRADMAGPGEYGGRGLSRGRPLSSLSGAYVECGRLDPGHRGEARRLPRCAARSRS